MKPKRIVRAFLVVIVLVIVLLIGVTIYADRLVKMGVETAGTKALGVSTTLGSADISLIGGSVGLKDFKVANPQGYQTPQMLQAGQLLTSVDLNTVFSDTIRVRQIILSDIELTIEQKGFTSNVQELINAIKAKQQPGAEKPQSDDLSGKKLVVDRIEINNASARVKLPLTGQQDVLTIKLAPIVLENVSPENKAALSVTVIQKVLLALVDGAVQAGGGVIPSDLLKGLEGSLGEMEQLLGGFMDETGRQLQDVGDTFKKDVDDLQKTGEGLLNILGDKKEEKP